METDFGGDRLAGVLEAALADATTREDGLVRALRVLGEELGWEAGACYLPERGALRCRAFWQAPGVEADALETVCWQTPFAPGRDLVGRVAVGGRPVWVADVVAQPDPVFRRTGAAAAAELSSVLAFPVPTPLPLAGVVELFGRRAHAREACLLRSLAAAGRTLGGFVAASPGRKVDVLDLLQR